MVSPTRTGAQHPQHLGSSISASFRWPAWHTRGGIRCDAGPNRVRGPRGAAMIAFGSAEIEGSK